MTSPNYQNKVRLLIDVLPSVTAEDCFAMHGGTAINLFVRDMPRLSEDIDLTYIAIGDRSSSLQAIADALDRIQQRIATRILNARATLHKSKSTLYCSRGGAQIKIEVNQIKRGCLQRPILTPLNQRAQDSFNKFAEASLVPFGQLYGGKVCAALARQHPRDLFDVKHMLGAYGLTSEIRRGFIFYLLACEGTFQEILQPRLLDQRVIMNSRFTGMTDEPFGYEEFEHVRAELISMVNSALTKEERRFILSFAEGELQSDPGNFDGFERFPALAWKLENIQTLKTRNPSKHRLQTTELADVLQIR